MADYEADRTVTMSRSLFMLAILYGGLVCIAGVLGAKLVALGPLTVEGGIFAFLLLVGTGSAVAEMHGKDVANRLVRFGFIPLIVAMLLIRLVIALPPASFWTGQAAFAGLLGQSSRMMLAGMIAYGTSQTLNIAIYARMKGLEGARLLWLRAAVASALSQIVDTAIFITISFYGVEPLAPLLVGQATVKVVLSAFLVPIFVYALVAVARRVDRPR